MFNYFAVLIFCSNIGELLQRSFERSCTEFIQSKGKMYTEAKICRDEPKLSRITNQFRPLITVLTILGPYRTKLWSFAEAKGPKTHGTVGKLTWTKLLSPFPYLLLLWYIFSSLVWAINVELDLTFPFRL